jgi:4-hydroxy-tetrahydrodipicolinate synthase
MFQGLYTALITPFRQGKIDYAAFEKLIQWQIEQGVHGLVPCGTTGESPTLSHEEHVQVVEQCVKLAKGKVKVMAGTGSNATDEAILLTKQAEKSGADGALVITPYYNKPTQEGLYQHFKAIHDATRIPIMVYNVPGRCVVDMSDALTARLAELPRIIGIKDATGNLERPSTLSVALGAKAKKFIQFSGEDTTAVAFNVQGGKGVISVTSNIAPKLCAEVQNLSLAGKTKEAIALQQKLMPLHKIMFCETSPGPVKYAASLLKLCREDVRLPLVPPSKEHKALIAKVVAKILS